MPTVSQICRTISPSGRLAASPSVMPIRSRATVSDSRRSAGLTASVVDAAVARRNGSRRARSVSGSEGWAVLTAAQSSWRKSGARCGLHRAACSTRMAILREVVRSQLREPEDETRADGTHSSWMAAGR